MGFRRTLIHVVLLLLLFSQQVAIAHGLTHVTRPSDNRSQYEESLPGEIQCVKCLVFSAFGSALAVSPFSSFTALPPVSLPLAAQPSEAPCSLILAFDTRAPPFSA